MSSTATTSSTPHAVWYSPRHSTFATSDPGTDDPSWERYEHVPTAVPVPIHEEVLAVLRQCRDRLNRLVEADPSNVLDAIACDKASAILARTTPATEETPAEVLYALLPKLESLRLASPSDVGDNFGERCQELYRYIESVADSIGSLGCAPLERVHGDLLPRIGSEVLIHLARQDEWVKHTVAGYYVWGDHKGDPWLQRVFVRVRGEGGYLNARMLCEVRKMDGTPLVVRRTSPLTESATRLALPDGVVNGIQVFYKPGVDIHEKEVGGEAVAETAQLERDRVAEEADREVRNDEVLKD